MYVDPVQPVRDEKLMFLLSKMESQGKAYLRVAEKIVDPLSSTTGMEVQECASAQQLVLNGPELVSLHLSERNGDFIEQVGQWGKELHLQHRWVAVPSSTSLLPPQLLCDPLGAVQAEVSPALRVSVVTVDCDQGPEQEQIPALVRQALTSLMALEGGGFALFKIGEFYQHRTKLILWLLFSLFRTVEIRKPKSSGRCTATKFVVCHDYQRQRYTEQFEALCQAIHADDNLSLLEFPLSWSYWLTTIQNTFTAQREVALKASLRVAQLLLQKKPYLSEQALQNLLERCWMDKNRRGFARQFIATLTDKGS
jgi:23S rRNA U2552 (ribose-2'-O)-methylase RlmE/FtsJ